MEFRKKYIMFILTHRVIIDGSIPLETADQTVLERQGNYTITIITVFSGNIIIYEYELGNNETEYVLVISSYCIFIDESIPKEIEEPASIDRQGIYFINLITEFFARHVFIYERAEGIINIVYIIYYS